jgi:hypothetical protein
MKYQVSQLLTAWHNLLQVSSNKVSKFSWLSSLYDLSSSISVFMREIKSFSIS